MVYGYLRLSKETGLITQQKKSIAFYAEEEGLTLDGFIEVAPYSKRSLKQKRLTFLLQHTQADDTLIVCELSQLGRNLLEVLNLLSALHEAGRVVQFVKQPELNTSSQNPIQKEILNVYAYFAKAERAFISKRTKQGLAVVKAKGVKLGRPKGHKNKKRALDGCRDEIMELLNIGLNLTGIQKVINQKLEKPLSYTSYKYFIDHDEELLHARHNFDKGSLLH